MKIKQCLLFVCCLTTVFAEQLAEEHINSVKARVRNTSSTNVRKKGYLHISSTEYGEKIVRIMWRNIKAIETVAADCNKTNLFFREVTNNQIVLHLIYQNNQLVDCDVDQSEEDVERFIRKFYGNTTSSFVNNHTKIKMRRQHAKLVELEGKYQPLLHVIKLKRRCKRLQRSMLKLIAKNNRHQDQKDLSKERKRRTPFFIYPGTMWCGDGDISTTYNEFGEHYGTDACCRTHDHCPYKIKGFETKFGLFNQRFHTINHCRCDELFRKCLKDVKESSAHIVGKVFFNVMGITCFTLEPKQVCVGTDFWNWGECTKYEEEYIAKLQTPADFI